MNENLIIRQTGSVGHISLDRPRALNALTQGMCEAMAAALLGWRDNSGIKAVIIDHAEGGRGFCAGGDVVSARRSSLEDGGEAGRAFFRAEYRLNHLLFTYPMPVVTFMDGITMGGGVGLALPAKYRVATENTLFAMPEGSIGLFPDIGAGWYLPRLPGQIGKFLALTGARLDGAECLWAALATHYLPSGNLSKAKAEIAANPGQIEDILKRLSTQPPSPRLARNKDAIDRLFAPETLEGILSALGAEAQAETATSKWAGKEHKAVSTKSPTSAKVALRLFAQSPRIANFAEEMAAEYRLVTRMIAADDFINGVRTVLIDKDNAPIWHPATPEEVTQKLLESLFYPLPREEEWCPL